MFIGIKYICLFIKVFFYYVNDVIMICSWYRRSNRQNSTLLCTHPDNLVRHIWIQTTLCLPNRTDSRSATLKDLRNRPKKKKINCRNVMTQDSIISTWQASFPPVKTPAHNTRSSMMDFLSAKIFLQSEFLVTGIWSSIRAVLDGPPIKSNYSQIKKIIKISYNRNSN